jgi:hypothetical protein
LHQFSNIDFWPFFTAYFSLCAFVSFQKGLYEFSVKISNSIYISIFKLFFKKNVLILNNRFVMAKTKNVIFIIVGIEKN